MLAVALALPACGGSGDGTTAEPEGSAPASSSAPATGLAGTWRLTVESPRRTFGTGYYSSATLALVGPTQIKVVGANHYESSFPVDHVGDLTITCKPALCNAGIVGFKPEGAGYRVVNAATLQGPTIATGADVCGAPAVPDAYLVKDVTATSFSFVGGRSWKTGTSCYQVLWTIRATKV